jgi:hypothetical protein
MADTHRIPVRVSGTLRGAAIDADAAVRLIDDVVSILIQDQDYSTRVDRLDGVVWETPMLRLHVGRDVVELTGHPGLQPLGARILNTAFALPELTRTMRSLGSRRGAVGTDHDRFFAGLLAARRAAEGFVEVESRLAAFDGRRLSQGSRRCSLSWLPSASPRAVRTDARSRRSFSSTPSDCTWQSTR